MTDTNIITTPLPARHPEPAAVCENCAWRGPSWEADQYRDFWSRIDPGDTMPAGDCPECGCHVFIDDARARLQDAAPALRDALADLWEWQAQQGGYEAPAWARARAVLDRL